MDYSFSWKLDGQIGGSKCSLPGRYKDSMSSLFTQTVGFFWDLENLQVPRGKSGCKLISKLREKFLKEDKAESEFIIVCDATREKIEVLDDLNEAQIKIVHMRATGKNSIDEKLKACISSFAFNNGAGSTSVLLSSDINYLPLLTDLKLKKGMNIIIVHKKSSDYLLNISDQDYLYDEFIENLPERKVLKESIPKILEVTSLPKNITHAMIKRQLAGIVENLGGKCGNVQGSSIEIRFPSTEAAEKAKRRLEQELLDGKQILVQLVETQQGITNPEGGKYINVGASTSKASVLPAEIETYSEDDEKKLNQASKKKRKFE